MISNSLYEVRRKLVSTAFKQLAEGESDFAIDHLPELIATREDLNDLRVAIAGLATRGALSERVSGDDEVQDLARQLREGKAKVDGASRRRRLAATSVNSEQPYEVPSNWTWLPLSEVTAMYNGYAFKAHTWKTSGLPIVRIQNLNKLHAPFNYTDPGTVADRHKIDTGDVLLSWSGTPGTSFGVFIWTRGPAALNQHIFKCELYAPLNARYFEIAVNEAIRKSLEAARGGVGLKHLTKKILDAMPIPIPSLAEQDRIVSAVDETEMKIARLSVLLAPIGDGSELETSDDGDVD